MDSHLVDALARRRVPIGFAAGALVWWLAQPSADSLAVGTILACVGQALRLWAAGHLYKSREVTASGPYRFVRHPLYLGSSIMGIGLALASGRVVAGAVIVAYLAITLTAAIRREDAFLRRTFGSQYDQYRFGDGREMAEHRPFSVRQVVANREYRSVAGLIAAVLLLLLKATYNGVFWGAAGR